jgi:4a-hydroxytetrahydrobiopterin dehydratase
MRGSVISRQFRFTDFAAAMRFVNRVARLAEAANHHPDITINYDRVRLALTTHDEGGLTMKDFRLASKINKFAK